MRYNVCSSAVNNIILYFAMNCGQPRQNNGLATFVSHINTRGVGKQKHAYFLRRNKSILKIFYRLKYV